MTKLSIKSIAILIIVVTLNISKAQVSKNSELFKTLKAQDSLLFNVGFNECNIEQIQKLLSEDLEFYQDKDGMNTSKTDFVDGLKKICNSGKEKTKRILDENSLQVFSLYDHGKLYGALQTGRHFFGNIKARFIHLWLLKNGEWMLSRAISYDHKENENGTIYNDAFIKLSPDELLLYLGDYEFSPDFVLSVIKEGNKIYGDAQGQKVEIHPIGDHWFLDESRKMRLHFILNKNGKVTGLEMTGPKGEMNAQKIQSK